MELEEARRQVLSNVYASLLDHWPAIIWGAHVFAYNSREHYIAPKLKCRKDLQNRVKGPQSVLASPSGNGVYTTGGAQAFSNTRDSKSLATP